MYGMLVNFVSQRRACSAMLCGRMLSGKNPLVSPRYVIILGMALFVLSMWDMGHLTTRSGEPDVRTALIIRGFGLGCLFTPINLAALSSLKGVEIAQGVSLLNLMRQLGGSFGIAYLGNHISNMTALHRNTLITHIYPGNPAFDERLAAVQQGLMAQGYDAAAAQHSALASIAGLVQTQATVMSFNDAFLFIGLTMLIVSPCVFLLRAGPPKAASASLEH